MKPSMLKFYIGLVLCMLSAGFMVYDMYSISGRIALGVIGLVLIATSKYRLRDRFLS